MELVSCKFVNFVFPYLKSLFKTVCTDNICFITCLSWNAKQRDIVLKKLFTMSWLVSLCIALHGSHVLVNLSPLVASSLKGFNCNSIAKEAMSHIASDNKTSFIHPSISEEAQSSLSPRVGAQFIFVLTALFTGYKGQNHCNIL